MINFKVFNNKSIEDITSEELKEIYFQEFNMPKLVFGSDAIENLSQVLFKTIPYQKVLFVSTRTPYGLYGERVIDSIISAKNSLNEFIFESSVTGNYSEAKQVIDCAEENTKAIVVLGGGSVIDICKYAANKLNIILIVIPTTLSASAVTDYGFITNGANEKLNSYKLKCADYVLVDTMIITALSDKFTAAGYGQFVCQLLSLFNTNYVKIMQNQNSYAYCKTVKECFTLLPQINESLLLGSLSVNLTLIQCLYACAITNNSGLISDDVCLALNLKSTGRLLGENMFLSSVFLSKIYSIFFAQSAFKYKNFTDVIGYLEKNNQIDFLASNISSVKCYKAEIEKLELAIYKLVEFNAEFKSEADYLCEIIMKCFKVFKRIYGDSGYSVLRSLTENMLKKALLEVESSSSIISPLFQIKNFGLIEEFCG